MPEKLIVAILAAGASSRLGQPKQLIPIAGEILLHRQCRIALDAAVASVTVVLGCVADRCARSIADMNLTIRLNENWAEGMASSIRVATRVAVEASADALLICHCDQYRLTADDFQTLYDRWRRTDGTIALRSAHAEYLGPPTIFPARSFAALLKLKGEQGAKGVLENLGKDSVIDVELPNAAHDLDVPSQIQLLRV